MTELSCAECRESTAEFALNILTGRERAEILAHLEHCADCRERVAGLAVTADRLVELLPDADPPSGFSRRVAGTLTPAPAAKANRRMAAPVLTIAVALLTGVGGWLWHGAQTDPAPAPAPAPSTDPSHAGIRDVVYVPLTGNAHPVGKLFIYRGDPSWIYLQVDNETTPRNEVLDCVAIRPDGSSVPLGTITLHNGRGSWAGPTKLKLDNLTATRLVRSSGDVVATGRFDTTADDQQRPTHHEHHDHHDHQHRGHHHSHNHHHHHHKHDRDGDH
jgi:hypothetical protein